MAPALALLVLVAASPAPGEARHGSPVADAFVVLSRHSGELVRAEGATALEVPAAPALEPFFPEEAARLGGWGPALRALGLRGLPADASAAVGAGQSLRISALGLAGAYRLLAEARPDLVDVMSSNLREGTLSGLSASAALDGVALRTGTVLDGSANPRLGWIAAVDRDLVLVMVRAGRAPRSFAGELARALGKARSEARGAARVQVFGLLDPGEVTVRCPRAGFAVSAARAIALEGEVRLGAAVEKGAAICVGGPWLVRVPGSPSAREYAGVFTREPVAGPAEPGPGVTAPTARPGPVEGREIAPARGSTGSPRAGFAVTAREARARRGSDVVFRTTRLLYAAGVATAEDASARGEARVALARVVDANVRWARHPGRPVCDTTHCQAFLGTALPGREDRAALDRPLRSEAWLPFSRGGHERWRESRPAAAVERALGAGARGLSFRDGRVRWIASAGDGVNRREEPREAGCEALRGPLALPSCPDGASADGESVVFEGRGAGHGEGLDLEWAKRSGLRAEAILERSYGRGLR